MRLSFRFRFLLLLFFFRHGSRAATTIADNWSKLESWWGPRADDDSKAKTLTVLKKLLAFDVKTATKPTSKSLSVIFKSYMTLLSSPSTLSFKVQYRVCSFSFLAIILLRCSFLICSPLSLLCRSRTKAN